MVAKMFVLNKWGCSVFNTETAGITKQSQEEKKKIDYLFYFIFIFWL